MNKKIFSFILIAGLSALSAGCSKDTSWLDKKDRSEPILQRAHARKVEGDIKSAIKLYSQALDINPRLAIGHLELAILLHDFEEKRDYIAAIYHYRRYLELRPDTEKMGMINDRIRLATQSFAGVSVAELEKERELLKKQLGQNKASKRIYIVKANDTLSSIAGKMYGDTSKWKIIYDANSADFAKSGNIKVGQKLVIP